MKMWPVNSSNIDAVGYADSKLRVRFHSGKTYEYSDVEKHHFDAILNGKSPGSHFHAHIRNRYATNEVSHERS